MTRLPSDTSKPQRPRLRAALIEEIAALQSARRAIHDPFARKVIDQKIRRLFTLLQKVATAAAIILSTFPPASAQEGDGYSISERVGRAPCGAYMAATGCIIALQNSANQCVAKFRKTGPSGHVEGPTAEQMLVCIRKSLAENGATDALSGPLDQPGD